MELFLERNPDAPAVDIALTEGLLRRAASGDGGAAIRIFRPGATAAFGRLDLLHGRLPDAAQTARAAGLTPVMRLAGGHAACYDQDSVVVEIVRPEPGVVGFIEARFEDLTDLLVSSLDSLGVAVEIGELPGEYCPGRFSVHLPAGPKIAGAAQRVIKGASLTNAVVSVGGGDRLRDVTERVYRSLKHDIDPRLTGAISDRHSIDSAQVAAALQQMARARYGAEAGALPGPVCAAAAAVAQRYLIGATTPAHGGGSAHSG